LCEVKRHFEWLLHAGMLRGGNAGAHQQGKIQRLRSQHVRAVRATKELSEAQSHELKGDVMPGNTALTGQVQ
jgi:hypothetical protein